jgi:amidase
MDVQTRRSNDLLNFGTTSELVAALARGQGRPLPGKPMVVKESFDVADLPTTWGVPAFRNFVPQDDAVMVARVKAAGAVILGKTNVP